MPGEKSRGQKKPHQKKLSVPLDDLVGKAGASGKKKPKDSQFVIRINAAERDDFVDLCDRLDTSAAREIRRFIRAFTAHHNDEPTSPKALKND